MNYERDILDEVKMGNEFLNIFIWIIIEFRTFEHCSCFIEVFKVESGYSFQFSNIVSCNIWSLTQLDKTTRSLGCACII